MKILESDKADQRGYKEIGTDGLIHPRRVFDDPTGFSPIDTRERFGSFRLPKTVSFCSNPTFAQIRDAVGTAFHLIDDQ